jgi:peptidoglycan/xylan/chitin deacetylase (PgdA/CDA1 family)
MLKLLKPVVKSGLRTVAATFGPHRWRRGPCLLVLTYHRVLPLDHPDRETEQPGMLVTPELLAMHFEVLKEYFTPVHLDDWLRAAKEGDPPPGRSLAITFDDGWRDNYDYAFPVLKAAEMPATLFLVTDMVGSHYQFWPNRLAKVIKAWTSGYSHHLDEKTRRRMIALGIPLDLSGSNATPELIDEVISRCKTSDDASMHALLDQMESVLPVSRAGDARARDLLDWEEVRKMADSGLVRFGSHSRRHTRLRADVPLAEVEDEVAGSRRILEVKLGRASPLFCYPNGDYSPAAYEMVRGAYDGAVSTQRGWNFPGEDAHMVRRISTHEDVSRMSSTLLARVSSWRGL